MSETLGPDDLRALVREVLRDTLPGTAAASSEPQPADAPPPPALADDDPAVGDLVVIEDDADLEAFVRRLVQLLDHPGHRRDLRAGRIRFRLAARAAEAPPEEGPATGAPVMRIEHGAVTERRVREAARSGASIVVGRSAVLTPLALDRARAMGVTVEKESR